MKTKLIKVCGLTHLANINRVCSIGVSHIGFIFYDRSPRFIEGKLKPEEARSIRSIKKVGVFVNSEKDEIVEKAEAYGLDMIQLHGEESPEFCRDLRVHIPVMKAFKIRDKEDVKQSASYEESSDFFLFDTAGKSYGGNGQLFNWDLLKYYQSNTPFFLSGGIGPEQIVDLQSFRHPRWTGIDINSKFETEPGYKDVMQIQQFLQKSELFDPVQSIKNQ